MWRQAIGLSTILLAGAATAQGSLENALQSLEVFDCSAEGARTLYVFQLGADGKVSLVGDEAAPVRIEGSGYSVMLSEGAREISPDAYFVYRDGTASSGTCRQVSDLARAVYPVITDGLLPEIDSTSEDAAGQAAAVLVQTMQSKLVEATAAMAELADLRVRFEASQAELATVRATAESATKALADLQASDAATRAELATTSADLADAMEAVGSFRMKLAEIAAQLTEAESGRMTAVESLEATSADLAALQSDYAAEVDVTKTLRAELDATTGVLNATEQERRSIVANVAMLNQKMSDLGGKLKAARDDTSAAEQEAKAAKAQIGAMSNLAKAALAQVATLQGRSVTAVRREICSLMSGARPSVC